ncbi:hypothetical protein HZQ97_16340 [Elizabethkingia anophelis]|uniref:hypothetical protein n=1 Tax=Elizabethkingia anophelis TaxID=1117645 RepID=UPI0021A53D09|nr:hypothetical protein [Elizabethkingia anophelis]MCT3645722.1 hypothetical protein [Elizabethkingia anophelis]MCT3678596.1 hypothetical protein [Elizabethkingia anophelis]MCT3686032.1 hypothetical protein [Elizabethkingia anophelis]CAH1145311.1 hypothetical protein EAVNVH72_03481 [Elizabethkingia anophelis]CAI9676947.1 hypothetical protein EAVNVH72_00160 [Elizabethkingia anophelis]
MILSFKTQINGKPTLFPEKIFAGLIKNKIVPESKEFFKCYRMPPMLIRLLTPKIHTIREDSSSRWKVGMMIDFFINARTKNMFRFAPQAQVISVQEIFMTRRGSDLEITISKEHSYIGGDDFYLYYDAKEQLSINDGFDSYSDFVKYFYDIIEENGRKTGNYWFKGKIIHWTDLKYEK